MQNGHDVNIVMAHQDNTTATLYWDTETKTLKASTNLPHHCGHQAKFQIMDLEHGARGRCLTLKSYALDREAPQSLVVVPIPAADKRDDGQVMRFQLGVSIQNC